MQSIKDTDSVDIYLLNEYMYLLCAFKDIYLKFSESGVYLGETSLEGIMEEVADKAINPIPMEMEFSQFKQLFLSERCQ